MNEFDYEASWRRLVKIFVLVLLTWQIVKATCFTCMYTGMVTYQRIAGEYGTDYADYCVAQYEEKILG